MAFAMKLSPNSDGHFPELEGREVRTHDKGITIAGLQMDTGAPEVAIVVPLEDGTGVVVKTSLKLFVAAAAKLSPELFLAVADRMRAAQPAGSSLPSG